MAGGTTLAFALCLLLFMNPILNLLGASSNTVTYARQYAFCVIVLGGLPTVLSNVMANLLRSVGESGKAGFGIAMGGVLNILLDPLFMFVLFPRGYEVLGVGVATFLSNCCACTFFVITVRRLRAKTVLRFRLTGGLPRKEDIRSVFAVGIPSCVATFLFDIDYIVINKLMSGYGDIALAAVGIVLKVERLPLMFMSFFTVYAFQGFGRGERALFLGVMRWAVFNIPMLFILNYFVGMYGIVWSQVTADTLTVLLSAFVYFSYRPRLIEPKGQTL